MLYFSASSNSFHVRIDFVLSSVTFMSVIVRLRSVSTGVSSIVSITSITSGSSHGASSSGIAVTVSVSTPLSCVSCANSSVRSTSTQYSQASLGAREVALYIPSFVSSSVVMISFMITCTFESPTFETSSIDISVSA
jgi:hypothetical protein